MTPSNIAGTPSSLAAIHQAELSCRKRIRPLIPGMRITYGLSMKPASLRPWRMRAGGSRKVQAMKGGESGTLSHDRGRAERIICSS
jgi:hypothetical protein